MGSRIGLLHSTSFTSNLINAIEDGLQANGWPEGTYDFLRSPRDVEGRYGRNHDGLTHGELEEIVTSFRDRPRPADVIIAAGGLVSPLAAYSVLSKGALRIPVVCLVGREPKLGEKHYDELHDRTIIKFIGELATPSKNIDRVNALHTRFGTVKATTALLVNTNSIMWQAEIDEWVAAGQPASMVVKFPDVIGEKDNDYGHLPRFFNAIKSKGIAGLVVSSDPFFFWYRGRLMQASKALLPNLRVCFAFDEYRFKPNGANHPDWSDNHFIAVGGKLADAYKELGKQTAKWLSKAFGDNVDVKQLE